MKHPEVGTAAANSVANAPAAPPASEAPRVTEPLHELVEPGQARPSVPVPRPASAAAAAVTPPAAVPPAGRRPAVAASGAFDDSTPLAREISDLARRRQALAKEVLVLPTATRVFTVAN